MKKTDFIFLLCFALLTLAPIPVFSLFREQIGYKNTENKAESDFPLPDLQHYSAWPRRFEEWVSDTLPFKTQFIELYRGFQFRAGLDYSQSDVIRGKDERLFYRVTEENYKGLTRFPEEELAAIRENLTGFFSQMEAGGTRCLLYIAPDKEQVYSRYMPDYIRRVSMESRGDQVLADLQSSCSFPVLYPKEELSELGETLPVYYDTDTHWNDLGGYYAAGQVKEAFTGEPAPSSVPDFHRFPEDGKDLAGMLGLSEWMPEKNTILIDHNDGISAWKSETVDYGRLQRYRSDSPVHKKLMIVGDSFAEHFLRSAIHYVDEILFVTYGQLYRIDLAAEDPDYLVVMLVERNLPFLVNGFY